MKVGGRWTLHTGEVSSMNLFQNKQVSWKVGEAWGLQSLGVHLQVGK